MILCHPNYTPSCKEKYPVNYSSSKVVQFTNYNKIEEIVSTWGYFPIRLATMQSKIFLNNTSSLDV